jgi:hypothetical protein
MPQSGLDGHTGSSGVQTGQSEWGARAHPQVDRRPGGHHAPGALGADELADVLVAPEPWMKEKEVRRDAEPRHALEILEGRAQGVLDAVARGGTGMRLHGALDSVHRHADAQVTLGVDGDLVSAPVGFRHRLVDLVLGIPKPFPAARVLRDIGLPERAGEALDRAVHEELDATKLEPRVIEALAEQLLIRHEEVVIDEKRRPDAPAALAHGFAVRPVRLGPRGGAAVVGRSDAEAEEHLLERGQPVLQFRE